jgi:hypothetical protein
MLPAARCLNGKPRPMFTARLVHGADTMAALGLVRICHPEIAIEHWRALFDHDGPEPRDDFGCVVVADQRGYAHAACLFRIALDPRFGRRMEVSYLSRADLPAGTASEVLFDFIDSLAAQRRCAQIMIEDADSRIAAERLTSWTDIGQVLADHQFRPGSVGFVKSVTPAPAG